MTPVLRPLLAVMLVCVAAGAEKDQLAIWR